MRLVMHGPAFRIRLCLALFMALSIAASAQDGASSPPTLVVPEPASPADGKKCVIAGMVNWPSSSDAVRRAMVTLVHEVRDTSGEAADTGEHVGTTDANGRFEFRNIDPGTYRVLVERNGPTRLKIAGDRVWASFVTIELTPGQEYRDLVLELQPGVAIGGTVKDENGEPMRSVLVRALHPMNNDGRHVVWPAGTATTDDRGEYRIAGLAAGNYLLEAVPSPPVAGSRHGYPHIFYPDATSRDQATSIRLGPGDDTVANFALLPVALGAIRGHVTGLVSGTARVIARMHNGELMRQVHVERDGSFELKGLLPGDYTLRAYEGSDESAVRVGSRTMHLDAGEIDAAEITAVPVASASATLDGKITVTGTQVTHGPFSSLNVNLIPEASGGDMDGLGGMRASASVDEKGNISMEDVVPGRYTLHLTTSSSGWEDFYTSSVQVAGRDATDAPVVIPSGGGSIPIEIAVAGDGAYVEGVVTDEEERPVANAIVTGIPDSSLRDQLDCYQQARTDRQGKYRLRGVRPGVYALYAWEAMEDSSFMDPEFMRAYENQGVSVRLASKDRQTVPLKLIVPTP